MKMYNQHKAKEAMRAILTIQDKQLLASELAKLMVIYTENLNRGWNIKGIYSSLIKQSANDSVFNASTNNTLEEIK